MSPPLVFSDLSEAHVPPRVKVQSYCSAATFISDNDLDAAGCEYVTVIIRLWKRVCSVNMHMCEVSQCVCVCSLQGVCAWLTMFQADVCLCNEVPTEARMFLSANFARVGWNTSILPSFNSHKSSLVISPITQPHGAVTPHHVRTYNMFSDLRPLKNRCKTQAWKQKDNHCYHHIHARAKLFSHFQRVQKNKNEAENKSEQEICWSPNLHKTTLNFLKEHVKSSSEWTRFDDN